ncbi:MAG TPA: hypothetical protein DD628_06235 [Clostridiales bacterium]|nr:hypothetical protein [Candidatus Apopatosoma intestinale]
MQKYDKRKVPFRSFRTSEKNTIRKVSLILFVQVKSGRKENFLLPNKTLTKADKKDKIYKR